MVGVILTLGLVGGDERLWQGRIGLVVMKGGNPPFTTFLLILYRDIPSSVVLYHELSDKEDERQARLWLCPY